MPNVKNPRIAKISIDQLCETLGVESPSEYLDDFGMAESISQYAWDYTANDFNYEGKSIPEDGAPGYDEFIEKVYSYEYDLTSKVYGKYVSAIESAADDLFGNHGMLVIKRTRKNKPNYYEIKPKNSWREVCKALVETINGYGLFHFRDEHDFISSIPDTYRGAALSHFHWMKSYSEVCGDPSPKYKVNKEMDRFFSYEF